MSKAPFKLSNINIYEVGWLVATRMIKALDKERMRLLRRSTLGKSAFLPYYRLVNRLRDEVHYWQCDIEWKLSDSCDLRTRLFAQHDELFGTSHYRGL